MENIVKIEPIAVKDKHDVVKALTILEKLGIEVMSDEKKKSYLEDESKVVDNNFMMQEEDGGFRIQSHYIGNGISIESLEQQVNKLLEENSNLYEELIELKSRREKLEEDITKLSVTLKEVSEHFPVYTIKEENR